MEKKTLDVGTLAELIIVRVKTDKTEPNASDNLRVGWETNSLLELIDHLLIYDRNDPKALCETGREVLACLDERRFPEAMALIKIAMIFRGERLLVLDEAQTNRVLQIIAEVRPDVESLPPGTRADRCLEILHYNEAIFYEAIGAYAMSASMHHEMVGLAKKHGRTTEVATSSLMESFCLLKQALCEGGDLSLLFESLSRNLEELQAVTEGSKLEISWGQGNGPLHLLQACVCLGIMGHPKLHEWVKLVLVAADQLGEAWDAPASFVRAIDMVANDYSPKATEALMSFVQNEKGNDETKAIALLVLARRAKERGEMDMAKSFVAQIAELSRSVQYVAALAGRVIHST